MQLTDLQKLLSENEGTNVEFKGTEHSAYPDAGVIAKTLVAFANTSGGLLIIGINDKTRHVEGVSNIDKMHLHIVNVARNNCSPALVPQLGQVVMPDGKTVAWARIATPNSADSFHMADSRIYIRVGNSNHPIASPDELRRWRSERERLFQETVRSAPEASQTLPHGNGDFGVREHDTAPCREVKGAKKMATKESDKHYLELAYEQSLRCKPEDKRTHPIVGAIVVKNGEVIATAYRGEGRRGRHAEFVALEVKLKNISVAGATLYTTLEPCTRRNHPKVPCAQRIAERKIARVVIGMLDPNPIIQGNGVKLLRKANIEIAWADKETASKIEEINRDFIRAQTASVEPAHAPLSANSSKSGAHKLIHGSQTGKPGKSTPPAPQSAEYVPMWKNLKQIKVSPQRLTCCQWSTNSQYLHTAGFEGILYSISSSTLTYSALHVGKSILRAVTTIGGSARLLLGDDAGRIYLADPLDNLAVPVGATSSPVYSMVVVKEADRFIVLTAERDGFISEWELYSPGNSIIDKVQLKRLRIIHQHSAAAFAVRYDPVERRYISAGADGKIRTTELASGKQRVRSLSSKTLFALSLAANHPLFVATDSEGGVWLASGDTKPRSLHGHSDTVRSAQLSPAGSWLATASKDGTVRLWHVTSKRVWILLNASDYLYEVAFSSDGTRLAACDGTGTLSIVEFGEPLDQLSPQQIELLSTQSK